VTALLTVLLACTACVSLNPYGPRLLAYPVQTVSIGTLQSAIDEWQSPDFHRYDTLPFLILLAASMFLIAVSPRRKTGREALLFAALAVLALVARRNLALFALCLAPAIAQHAWSLLRSVMPLPDRVETEGKQPRALRALNLGLLILVALAAGVKMAEPLSPARNARAVREQQPVGAIAYLKERRPEGQLFNSYNWGGYLIWDIWPLYLTYVDGRTDLFDDEVLDGYLTVWNGGDGWQRRLESSGVRLALIEPRAPVVDEMTSAGWKVLYSDSQAVVLAAPASEAAG